MNDEYTHAPHRRETKGPAPNAALLIDFDNVTMGIRSNLGHELRKLLDSDIIRGKVSVQRAYADWRRYPQYIVPLAEASIDLIFAPAYGSSKKNATDIRLAIDATELVFTRPEIGTYILLSGDSDFSSLVLKLKEYGKYVIGVGMRESSSDLLVQNCDEYYSYSTISGLSTAGQVKTDKYDPWELVERALSRMRERNDVMRSDRLKQVMLELDSGFDEKDLGFSKFNRFLAEAASREKVGLRKAANGQYEVFPAGDGRGGDESRPRPSRGGSGRRSEGRRRDSGGRRREEEAARTSEPRPAESRETAGSGGGGDGGSLRGAYGMLVDAVKTLGNGRDPVRDSEVKREMLSRDSGFDEAELGFRKFSRFLQQAHDEGIIDLSQGDDGNYYLLPPGGRETSPAGGRKEEKGPETPRAVEEPGETEAPAASAARGGRGRSRRGVGRRGRRGRRGGEAPSGGPSTGTGPQPERVGEPETPGAPEEPGETEPPSGERAPAPEAPEAPEATATGGDEAADAEPRAASPGRAGRGGLGRFRRGSRGGRSPSAPSGSTKGVRIGPVELDEDDDGGSREEEAATETAATGETSEGNGGPSAGSGPEASGSAPRGVGLFRRGSREGRTPGGRPEPGRSGDEDAGDEDAGDEGRGEEASGDGPGASAGRSARTEAMDSGDRPPGEAEIIEHMVRSYAGVGKKTAERLVDEFGRETFRVLDRQPERVGDVLSERRARAVLEAREAERDDYDTSR